MPRLPVSIAGSCERYNPTRQGLVGLIELVNGLRIHLFLLIRPAKPEMRQRELGAHSQRLAQLADRPIIVMSIKVIESDVSAYDDRQGIEFAGAVYLGPGLLHAAHREQVVAVPLVSGRIIWIELDGSLEL